jgi:hypothetical protein
MLCAARAKITNFKSLKEEMPMSEAEIRETYRARLVVKLKAKRAVLMGKEKGGAPSAGSPADPSL